MRDISRILFALLLTSACAGEAVAGESLAERYRSEAGRLIGAALVSDKAHARLGELCDAHPRRLSGSAGLEKAIVWCASQMRGDGFANVRMEEVMVPAWVRGHERARIVAPVQYELSVLTLGGSVGTPPGGIEAEVVVVSDFDELEALGEDRVAGRIVLYNAPFVGYGKTVKYRTRGATRAAKLGAVASLTRSIGPSSFDTPHCGGMGYSDDARRIPAAAVTIENATMIARMVRRGETVRVRLDLGAHQLEDRPSANVVAEVRGRTHPEEIVVVGGHIDAWDVGQGAQDDGVGCVIAWEAARLIQALDLRPRRTIRVVLFTNEENGTRGGRAYAEGHADAMKDHVAVIESDSGNGPAAGFRFQLPPLPEDGPVPASALEAELSDRWQAVLDDIGRLLEPVGASNMAVGHSGADVGHSVKRGVPGLGLDHDTTEYFKIHHTHADTFEKVIKYDLDRNVAAMAVMVYVLADMPGRLARADDPEVLAAAAAR